MAGQLVEFASNGSQAQGYLARPASGRGPGVIVIQEWWGLVDHIKGVADRFAAEGFFALAPDLYHGETTTNPDDAGRLMMAINIDRAVRDLAGCIEYLVGLEGVSPGKVGTVGFCMGGQLALAVACKSTKVGACADFYGVHPAVTLDQREHGFLGRRFTERLVFGLATNIGLVGLDDLVRAAKTIGHLALAHRFANTVRQEPCAFIGDLKRPV